MNFIERIKALVEKGYEAKLTPIVEQLELVARLPEKLREKLESFGNTPVAEPVLYEAIERSQKEEGPAIIALNALSEEEIVQYEANDIGVFIHAIQNRIMSHRDENGVFKSTPNTQACKLPNFIECDQIRKLMIQRDEWFNKWSRATTDKLKKENAKKFGDSVNALSKKALEISGLDLEILTDWEKALVADQVLVTVVDAFACATGKGSGN